MSKLMRITVVGSLNYDLVTEVDVVPRGGETIPARSFDTHYGGKGANQAYAISRLIEPGTASVAMIGSVGKDVFGQELIEHLKGAGVDVSQVSQLESTRTGVATILVEKDGENRIMVFPGANGQVYDAEKHITSEDDFVVLQNEIPLETTFAVLRRAQDLKTRSIFNPSPLPNVSLDKFPYIDVLIVNAGEAAALTGQNVSERESAFTALPKLLEVSGLSLITLGADGVAWQEKGSDPMFVPSEKVETVVDTTGAGDTFLAAFVSRLLDSSLSHAERIDFATKAAAIAVTRKGAASSIPSLQDIRK